MTLNGYIRPPKPILAWFISRSRHLWITEITLQKIPYYY